MIRLFTSSGAVIIAAITAQLFPFCFLPVSGVLLGEPEGCSVWGFVSSLDCMTGVDNVPLWHICTPSGTTGIREEKPELCFSIQSCVCVQFRVSVH